MTTANIRSPAASASSARSRSSIPVTSTANCSANVVMQRVLGRLGHQRASGPSTRPGHGGRRGQRAGRQRPVEGGGRLGRERDSAAGPSRSDQCAQCPAPVCDLVLGDRPSHGSADGRSGLEAEAPAGQAADLGPAGDDLVDQAVRLGLVGRQVAPGAQVGGHLVLVPAGSPGPGGRRSGRPGAGTARPSRPRRGRGPAYDELGLAELDARRGAGPGAGRPRPGSRRPGRRPGRRRPCGPARRSGRRRRSG